MRVPHDGGASRQDYTLGGNSLDLIAGTVRMQVASDLGRAFSLSWKDCPVKYQHTHSLTVGRECRSAQC